MKRLTLIALIALTVTGCASDAYYQAHQASVLAWERAEVARAQARYSAIGEYAKHGNSHAQVLAVALLGNGGGDRAQFPVLANPEDNALRWASIILPVLSNVAIAGYGAKVAIAQSDNSRYTAEASYAAMGQGYAATRDVAMAGFDAFRNMPPSSQSSTTISVGSNAHAAWDGGTMNFDSSRRCTGSWPNSSYGIYQGSAPFNC